MATPFTDVYDFFLSKVTDYDLLPSDEFSATDLQEQLYKYLRSAIIRFKECDNDLQDRDDTQFNDDLSDEEKEILSTLMLISYLTPKIVSTENMKPKFSDKEFKAYSQANQLKELKSLKKELTLESSQLINSYTYNEGLGEFLT